MRNIKLVVLSLMFTTAVSCSDGPAVTDSIMRIAVKKYPDVYFNHPDAGDKSHIATVDGTHPDNYGYSLWSESIRKPVLRILKKYGIR